MSYNNIQKDKNMDEIMSEAPEYSSKSEFSKPILVSKAVENCMIARSKEMKEGYYNYQMSGDVTTKIWISDSRKTYCESVNALKLLLLPEIRRNESIKKIIDECKKSEEKIFKKYAIKKNENSENRIPKIGETKTIKQYVRISDVRGYWSSNKSVGHWDDNNIFYWDDMIKISDKLFETLNILIDSLNYFKSGVSF